MFKKQPAIILTSKFTSSYSNKSFGKYLGYMARKEALEGKEYLTQEEQDELKRVTTQARELDVYGKFFSVRTYKDDSLAKREAKTYLNEKNFAELSNEEFGKYLGYMSRIEALATKKDKNGLTVREENELKRVKKATSKLGDVHPMKDKVAIGTFTQDLDKVRLEDFQHIRDKLNEGQANGSVMWQDVISFDNNFLEKIGILNRSTGELDETLLKNATRKMMSVFEEKMDPPLYKPYWTASIHRNTDNIHIHIATVEAENHREMIKRAKMVRSKATGELVPTGEFIYQSKGRRPLSVIDAMKFTFANEITNTSKLTKEISDSRNNVRANLQETFKRLIDRDDFQKNLDEFAKHLPESRRDWNYSYFEKNDPEGKSKLDKLTESLVKDDPEFQKFVKEVKNYQQNRQELYGKSKRKSKNYAENKLKDIRRRNGNTLLHELARMDKQAAQIRRKIKVLPINRNSNYIQSVLKTLEYEQENREQEHRGEVRVRRKQINRINQKHKERERKKWRSQFLTTQEKKKMEAMLRKQTRKEIERQKALMSKETQRAMNEYERIQQEVQRSQQRE